MSDKYLHLSVYFSSSPEAVCYCSSPENDVKEKLLEMKGLKLISRDSSIGPLKSSSDHNSNLMPTNLKSGDKERPCSPTLPLYAPIPLRPSYDKHQLITEIDKKITQVNSRKFFFIHLEVTSHFCYNDETVPNNIYFYILTGPMQLVCAV